MDAHDEGALVTGNVSILNAGNGIDATDDGSGQVTIASKGPWFRDTNVSSANLAGDGASAGVEQTFGESITIAANTLAAGDAIEVRVSIVVVSDNASDTWDIRAYSGGDAIMTGNATNFSAGEAILISILIPVLSIGASGAYHGYVKAEEMTTGGGTLDVRTALLNQTWDTTGALVIDIRGVSNNAHASEVLQLQTIECNIRRAVA